RDRSRRLPPRRPEPQEHGADPDLVAVGEGDAVLDAGLAAEGPILARQVDEERSGLGDVHLGVAPRNARRVEAERRVRVAPDEVRPGPEGTGLALVDEAEGGGTWPCGRAEWPPEAVAPAGERLDVAGLVRRIVERAPQLVHRLVEPVLEVREHGLGPEAAS